MAPALQAIFLACALGWAAGARSARAGGRLLGVADHSDDVNRSIVMSALEVPAEMLGGEAVALVVVDGAGEEHRLTVHAAVLEGVEYFQTGERWRSLLGKTENRAELRVELPTGCGREGAVALLRRLYAWRPWPAAAWAEVGPAATREAAVLADMWLLSDIAQETRAVADGTVITVEGIRGIMQSMLLVDGDDTPHVRAFADIAEHLGELGAEHVDALIDGLNATACTKRQEYNGAAYRLRSRSFFQSWCTVARRGCRAHPSRVSHAVAALVRIRDRLFECTSSHFAEDDDSQVVSCMRSLLDVARDARTAGHLSAESYDAMLLGLEATEDREAALEAVSSQMILAMQAEARAKLVEGDMSVFSALPENYAQELAAAITAPDRAKRRRLAKAIAKPLP